MFTVRKVGDWATVARITRTMRDRYEASVRRALLAEAHFLRGKMIEGIASGAPGGVPFAPLSPITLALRKARGFGGTKPLMVTGTLRRSITVVHVRGGGGLGGAVFVGVHRQAKARDGRSLADLASIHEYGRQFTQSLSPRARRYLFAILRKSGPRLVGPRHAGGRFTSGSGSAVSIHIPARPFIRPVFARYGRPADVRQRFVANVLKGMGGDFRRLGGG